MNRESSRSHLIMTICIEATNLQTQSVSRGKLSFVDLAGSERCAALRFVVKRWGWGHAGSAVHTEPAGRLGTSSQAAFALTGCTPPHLTCVPARSLISPSLLALRALAG